MSTRIEKDSLWEREILEEVLYGIQTLRSKENYQISRETIPEEIIVWYAHVKKAAARANAHLGKLDPALSLEILQVCDELIAGKYREHFVVDIFQAGAGTATHMNVNEVIANKILENRGEKKGSYHIVSPNDHVNMSQSTNDTYPTVMRIALLQLSELFIVSAEKLIAELKNKSEEFSQTITSARTHLQDAVPITLGQEFWAYALSLEKTLEEFKKSRDLLKDISLGGSAVGTGINTHPEYQKTVVEFLNEATELSLHAHENMIEGTQSQRQIGNYMSALKSFVLELSRICNDLRILSSGPHTGISEISLPAVQPGSSIMPGKVNPSILEAAGMVHMRVIGAESTTSQALAGAQLNLNVWMPLMASEAIYTTKILTNSLDMLREKCISGITANTDMSEKYAHESNGIFTALNPVLGYAKVAELVKKRDATGKTLRELLWELDDISQNDIEQLLDPKKLTSA